MTFLLDQLRHSVFGASTKMTKGTFQTSIQFKNGKTVFIPDCNQFLTVVNEDVFEGISSLVQQVEL